MVAVCAGNGTDEERAAAEGAVGVHCIFPLGVGTEGGGASFCAVSFFPEISIAVLRFAEVQFTHSPIHPSCGRVFVAPFQKSGTSLGMPCFMCAKCPLSGANFPPSLVLHQEGSRQVRSTQEVASSGILC